MEPNGVLRRSRDSSPDRARICMQPRARSFRKVQVIYYLCRNGQLEHPHFMEVSHLLDQHLRLKDVMDKLTVLRGRGMPSLYSWSCKRSYKNGFVWNDLTENDVIYPTEGAEYILKGSEIIDGRTGTERFHQLQLSTQRPKPRALTAHHQEEEEEGEEMEEEEDEEAEEIEEKGPPHNNSSSSNTPCSRCSRGVSTDGLLQLEESTSPPSSSSFEKEKRTVANIPTNYKANREVGESNRFEDPDRAPTRTPSVLLQLIACGSAAVKGRTGMMMKHYSTSPSPSHDPNGSSGRKSAASLHRGVVTRLAAAREDEESNVIRCMSEDPRFGNPLREDKEYFSGSIIEVVDRNCASEPSIKKSSSYNEERSMKSGIGEEVESSAEERSVKGKCLPSRRRSTLKVHQPSKKQ